MSTVRQVLMRYQNKVAFPVTPTKIARAGYQTEEYLTALIRDIMDAEDSDNPLVKEFLAEVEPLLPK